MLLFFFKQKTAYEMRISDWSSDVCSSDLHDQFLRTIDAAVGRHRPFKRVGIAPQAAREEHARPTRHAGQDSRAGEEDDIMLLPIGRASCRERVCQYV